MAGSVGRAGFSIPAEAGHNEVGSRSVSQSWTNRDRRRKLLLYIDCCSYGADCLSSRRSDNNNHLITGLHAIR